ncbi:MAG: tRNA (guanosine(37)-N1)-methyltransferase TrmD [Patescibacteria group bacterium]
MKIDILTLFPEMFKGPFDTSMIKKAKDEVLVEINIHNLRKWAKDKHKTVDDRPYGGGLGMVIKVEPVYEALKDLKSSTISHQPLVILLSPQGQVFNQQTAKRLSKLNHVILIAGHYEGFDERIREHLVDEEISIGDYVLTGGEIPAMVVIDSVVRLIPGVLEEEAKESESFQKLTINHKQSLSLRDKPLTILDFPQYTRPENYSGWKVPEVLLSGNHAEIEKWRKKQSVKRTKEKRPDLLKD